ncbi:hypothetical protein Peur_011276 [Populus x canadensis]
MVDRIQEAHIPRHINVQWNILKFKSSLFREDAMGEVELAGGKGVSVQFMQIYRRSREVGSLQWPWDLCSSVYNCIPIQGIIGHLFFMPRIARLKKLSLSGLLLFKLCIADQFFVQWRHNYRENILELTMLAVSCG